MNAISKRNLDSAACTTCDSTHNSESADRASAATLLRDRMAGYSLPQAGYTSGAIFRCDMIDVLARRWVFVGHVSQLSQAGQFITLQVGVESVLITRDANGKLHALFNVCRHRGSRLIDAANGKIKALVCPYHHWTYDLAGQLKAAPGMSLPDQAGDLSLHKARLETWQGFIYVCLNPCNQLKPLAKTLAPAADVLVSHRIDQLKIAATRRYDIAANWKLFMENYRECYHCRAAHPQFCTTVEMDALDNNRTSDNTRLITAPDATFTRYDLRTHAVTQSIDGRRVSRLLGELQADERRQFGLCLYPAHAMIICGDYVMTLAVSPRSASRSTLTATWWVHADAVAGSDYDPDHLIAFWDVTNQQDVQLCDRNQLGVNSIRYSPGPYCLKQENDVEHFISFYTATLGKAITHD